MSDQNQLEERIKSINSDHANNSNRMNPIEDQVRLKT